mmetsp:Transcript_24406/g.56841  ORF Transcript_24406/g.56841 Transcript_24406/m.56841 type:complete len:250 (+) Transcript_24406:1481-2230(+)
MSTEKVTLRLNETRWKGGTTVLIEVGQGSRHGRRRNATGDAERRDATPRCLTTVQFGRKGRIDHEIGQARVAGQCILDLGEQLRPDDASTTPHACATGQIHVPIMLLRSGLDDTQTLCIRTDLGTIQGCLQIGNHLILVDGWHLGGSFQNLGGIFTFRLASTDVTGIERSRDGRSRDTLFGRFLNRPSASTLHTSLVQNVVHDVSFARHIVLFGQNLGGDLDKEGIQLPFVPLDKQVGHLFVVHAHDLV